MSSVVVETVSTVTSYRVAKASMISSTSTSGAEAPAVRPSRRMLENASQSRSSARLTSRVIGQPTR
jgi:hypothetical protein